MVAAGCKEFAMVVVWLLSWFKLKRFYLIQFPNPAPICELCGCIELKFWQFWQFQQSYI